MTNLGKLGLFLVGLILLSIVYIKWGSSPAMLVESSIAVPKSVVPDKKDVDKLFSALGISNGAMARLYPCLELQEYTKLYCTPQSIQNLLNDDSISEGNKMFLKMDDCGVVVLHIGQMCYQDNFERIVKYYSP